jgi:ketosteroid isomerase-like protein
MSQDTMQVVFALLDARRRRDIQSVKELLDPDVVHHGVTDELVCHGREQVLENVRRGFEPDDAGVDHLELVSAGHGVILGLAGPRFRDAPWAHLGDQLFVVHTVRDGRVVLMRDFLNRAEAFGAAGMEPVDWS